MKSRTFDFRGHRIVEITRNCVRQSLTEEAHDLALESVEDWLGGSDPRDTMTLVHSQETLVDYFKYYLGDLFKDQVDNYRIVGDSRNNLDADVGKTFFIEAAFTVKNALIATKISYTIHYKTS